MILPRYHRDFSDECKKYRKGGCKNCISYWVCPLLKWCGSKNEGIINCSFVEKQVYSMIEAGICFHHMEKASHLSDWLWKKSDLGKKLVQELLSLPKKDSKRELYFRFFGVNAREIDNITSPSTSFSVRQGDCNFIEVFMREMDY